MIEYINHTKSYASCDFCVIFGKSYKNHTRAYDLSVQSQISIFFHAFFPCDATDSKLKKNHLVHVGNTCSQIKIRSVVDEGGVPPSRQVRD